MKRILLLIAIAWTLALPAWAQQQTIDQKAQVCATCHGEKGIPIDKSYPIIWGQHQGYLFIQLRDFKSGARKNEFMQPVVAELNRDDMMALAEYFSKKTWPDLRQKSASDADAAVAHRVNVSIGCTGCHLGQYRGDATVPRLAGQNHDYLLKEMKAFRSRERGNNPGMSDLMKATPEADLVPEANFLAGD
jgi:cytochrome c553